jgi:hypothetical protein
MSRFRLVTTLLSAGWLILQGATAPPATARETPPVYPSTEALRQVQLAGLACSRENTPDSCSKARTLADPLMDNPLLPAFCKDAVWEMLQKAQPAATNTYQRREELNRASDRLLRSCQRQPPRPKPEAAGGQSPGQGQPGFGFGTGRP